MPQSRPPYPAAFRQQIIELVVLRSFRRMRTIRPWPANTPKRSFMHSLAAIFGISAVGLFGLALAFLGLQSADAQNDSAALDIEINHVGISVANLEESVDWYVEMLGFELVRPIDRSPDAAMTIALLRRANFNIELFEVEGAAPLPEYRRDPSSDLRVEGLAHFAFRVDDARAVLAELESKGVEIVFGPNESERSILFFVSDNSGNTFEFIQPK